MDLLEHRRAAHLRNAAGLWGAADAPKFTIPDSQAHLQRAWSSKNTISAFLERCSPHERTALGIVKRHGGALTGRLLTVEAELRGLVEKGQRMRDWSSADDHSWRERARDPVGAMIDALALVPAGPPTLDKQYPGVVLNPCLERVVDPVIRVPWPGEVFDPPRRSLRRPIDQVQAELDRGVDYLIERGSFPVNKHGWPTKPVLKGIAKATGLPSTEPWSVLEERASQRREWGPFSTVPLSLVDPAPLPQPEGLLAGLLVHSGLVKSTRGTRAQVPSETWNRFRGQPTAERVCVWLRAWLEQVHWQDGIGLVPDEDKKYEPERITPWELVPSKHTLIWALSLLPPAGWVTLNEFLHHIHRLTDDHYGVSFYWDRFIWGPEDLPMEDDTALPVGRDRSRAFWLSKQGVWIANVLLVTFTWLGLVERGEVEVEGERQCVFRLTEETRSALGS